MDVDDAYGLVTRGSEWERIEESEEENDVSAFPLNNYHHFIHHSFIPSHPFTNLNIMCCSSDEEKQRRPQFT